MQARSWQCVCDCLCWFCGLFAVAFSYKKIQGVGNLTWLKCSFSRPYSWIYVSHVPEGVLFSLLMVSEVLLILAHFAKSASRSLTIPPQFPLVIRSHLRWVLRRSVAWELIVSSNGGKYFSKWQSRVVLFLCNWIGTVCVGAGLRIRSRRERTA